jgi:hypothetical protein
MLKKINLYIIAMLAVGLFAACSGSTEPDLSEPDESGVRTIVNSTTELSGPMRGTLQRGKTYQLTGDLIILPGEEIRVEPGVTIIANRDAASGIGFEITNEGSFIALGTAAEPILLTVPQADRIPANKFAGLWGGIQGAATTKAIVLKHVRMEYTGAIGGEGNARAGSIRYGLWTRSDQTEVVIEDSWFYGSKDDFFRPVGGKLNIVRNVFEYMGEDGGDIINVKGGTVGNIAYNLVIGAATNAFKPSDDGSSTIQSNIGIYNNTILNSGWRRAGANRGSNINFEEGARGFAYNNILVNNKNGLRVLASADVQNVKYNNNLVYGTFEAMAELFLNPDSVTERQPNDIIGGAGENNPQFVNYDVNRFSWEDYQAGVNQPNAMNVVAGYNFRLAAGSPARGAGRTDFTPVAVSFTLTGAAAPTILPPSIDMGAYPVNGSGLTQN